jgi:hypothetical protein
MFEILVNGTPRSYRDRKELAIDAGRNLKGRDKSEITVVNRTTGHWAIIVDPYAFATWKEPPALTVVRQTA